MSEKRELNDVVNGSDQSPKRRKLDEISEDGPLTQRDVVYFQKEAIFRQMTIYKNEVSQVQKRLQTLDDQYNSNNSKLLVLMNWIDQFIESISSVIPQKELVSNEAYKILFADVPKDIKDDEFIDLLNQKKAQLSELINKITSSSPAPSDEDLKEKLFTIGEKYHNLKLSNQKLYNEYALLKKNFDQLTNEFNELSKKTDRSDSITLQRVNGNKNDEQGTPKLEKEASIPAQSNNNNNNDDGNNGFNNNDSKKESFDSDEVDSLKKQVDEFKSTIEAQQKIIDENLELNKSLNSKVVDLTLQKKPNGSSSSNGVAESFDSSKFEELSNENKEINIKYKEILQKHDSLLERFNNLESEKTSDNDLLNSKFEEEKQKLVSNFGKLEADLIRIRTARDELLSKITILEAERNGLDVTKELTKIIEIQKDQIENISFEKKLDEIIGNVEISKDVDVLLKNNTILTNELKELEKAFKHLQNVTIKKVNGAVDSESIINKFKVEKAKADQKYFAAMRSKDSILQENKTLKTQISKLNELINNLKDSENLSNSRFSNLEQSLKNLKKIEYFRSSELDRYIKQINELEKTNKSDKTHNEEIKSTLQDFKTKNEELTKIKNEYYLKISKLESNIKSQDKMIQRFKFTGVLEDQSEADSFRSLIYCSLCSKNWKNTAIKVCGHVFCEECAKERIAARMRKCPSCNKQFSSNDLMTIHL